MKIIIIVIILALLGILIIKYMLRPVKVNTEATKQNLEKEISKSANHIYYRFNQASSTIKFSINENKSDGLHTISGINNQIYADLTIDQNKNELSVASNTINIDARTFKTDSVDRDGSINRIILKSTTPGNEFITFNLNPVSNLPELLLNTPLTLYATGTLTISKVSNEINFPFTLTKTQNGLIINFKTKISRKAFNIKMPGFPGTTVNDEIEIEANITANQF